MSLNNPIQIHKLELIDNLGAFVCQLGHYVLIENIGLFELKQGSYSPDGENIIQAKEVGSNYYFVKVLGTGVASSGEYLPLSGGTMTGGIVMGNTKIEAQGNDFIIEQLGEGNIRFTSDMNIILSKTVTSQIINGDLNFLSNKHSIAANGASAIILAPVPSFGTLMFGDAEGYAQFYFDSLGNITYLHQTANIVSSITTDTIRLYWDAANNRYTIKNYFSVVKEILLDIRY